LLCRLARGAAGWRLLERTVCRWQGILEVPGSELTPPQPGGQPRPYGSFAVLCGALVHAIGRHLARAAECYSLALKGRGLPASRLIEWDVIGADEVAVLWAVLAEHREKRRLARIAGPAPPKRARVGPTPAERVQELERDLAHERSAKRYLEGIATTTAGEIALRDERVQDLEDTYPPTHLPPPAWPERPVRAPWAIPSAAGLGAGATGLRRSGGAGRWSWR
jgi:hypothetical protein